MSSLEDAARQAARVQRALMGAMPMFQAAERARQMQMAFYSSSMIDAIEGIKAMQRAFLDSPMFQAIENARQMQEQIAKACQPLAFPVSMPFHEPDTTIAMMNALAFPDAQSPADIRRVVVTKTVEETNRYLNAGWTVIETSLASNDPAGEGSWMLGWTHDEDPKEPEAQE